jgi:hypothetical protein
MFLFHSINLPPPILFHSISLTGLGLYFITRPPPTSADPFAVPQGRAHEISSILGLLGTSIGLAYLTTSYMPVAQNQFLYASVPIRLTLGALAGGKLLLERMRGYGISAPGRRELVGILIYDLVGAVGLGWWLGTWKGKVRGY